MWGVWVNLINKINEQIEIKHEISIIVDRIILNSSLGNRLADSVETAVNLSNGLLVVEYENETLPKKFRVTISPILKRLNIIAQICNNMHS